MKKQIFIILLLVMTSSTYVIGQAVHKSFPLPLTGCSNGPLSPIAGNSYNYSATADPSGGLFHWWATTDQNFITSGANNIDDSLTIADGELLAYSSNYGSVPGTTQNNVDITWSSTTLAAAETTPTFVVFQYDAPAGGCANNLKVYIIDPINGFTVDIKNMYNDYDTAAYGVTIDTCVSPISSAVYVPVDTTVAYDFGDNQLLFEVVLANFSDAATVSFNIDDLVLSQTADLAWGYTPATAGTNSLGTDLGNGDVLATASIITSEPNTGVGVSIFVLATVNNNSYEGLTDTPFTLAVNAENAEGNPDVVNSDCTVADFEDTASQILLARPGVTDTTPPAGDDFLPIAP